MSNIRLTIDLPRGTPMTDLCAAIRGLGCEIRLSRDGAMHASQVRRKPHSQAPANRERRRPGRAQAPSHTTA